jgi:hypothetical protein
MILDLMETLLFGCLRGFTGLCFVHNDLNIRKELPISLQVLAQICKLMEIYYRYLQIKCYYQMQESIKGF